MRTLLDFYYLNKFNYYYNTNITKFVENINAKIPNNLISSEKSEIINDKLDSFEKKLKCNKK